MNHTEFLTLQAQRSHRIRGRDLFDSRHSRTLMYGQDFDGCVRHTYLDHEGQIRVAVLAAYSESLTREAGWALVQQYVEGECSNRDYVPSRVVNTAFSDYEFASRLIEAGVSLHLTESESEHHVLLAPSVGAFGHLRSVSGLTVPESVAARVKWVQHMLGLEASFYVAPADGRLFVLDEDYNHAIALLGTQERDEDSIVLATFV